MNALPCLRAETLSTIARLAPRLETFRSAQLASAVFRSNCVQQYHVRVRFRTLVTSQRVNAMGVECLFLYKLPNGRTDGRVLSLDTLDNIACMHAVNGTTHGVATCWSITHDGVRLLYSITNKFGKPHGAFTQWYPSGMIRAHSYNIDGVRHGEYTAWNPDGTLNVRQEYDMGRLIVP